MLPAEITRHRFTVEEYHKMAEAGVFSEDDRVELIEGEVVQMTSIEWRHARCVSNSNMLPARFAGDRYVVSVQNPMSMVSRSPTSSERYPRDDCPARGRSSW